MFVNYLANIPTMPDPTTKGRPTAQADPTTNGRSTAQPDPTTKPPLIPQPWLRLLLFGCTFCGIALLIGIPAILSVTASHLADLEKDSFQLLSGLMAGDFLWLMLTLEFLTSL